MNDPCPCTQGEYETLVATLAESERLRTIYAECLVRELQRGPHGDGITAEELPAFLASQQGERTPHTNSLDRLDEAISELIGTYGWSRKSATKAVRQSLNRECPSCGRKRDKRYGLTGVRCSDSFHGELPDPLTDLPDPMEAETPTRRRRRR